LSIRALHAQSSLPAIRPCCAPEKRSQELSMMDMLMLALGLGFFALAIGYSYACERL
jgi:hypothetical protein